MISQGNIRVRGDTRQYSGMKYRGILGSSKRYVAVRGDTWDYRRYMGVKGNTHEYKG